MVTSSTNSILSQGIEVVVGLGFGVFVGGIGESVGVEGVFVHSRGVGDAEGVGDPSMAMCVISASRVLAAIVYTNPGSWVAVGLVFGKLHASIASNMDTTTARNFILRGVIMVWFSLNTHQT
jgi:hypothetical protein